ncbi:MAG TPA: hypothetical protein DCF70_04920 [Treponema sp.]|nr:hypothetical protein [Treponema sp.]
MDLPVFDKQDALDMLGCDMELYEILLDAFIGVEFSREHLEKLIKQLDFSEAASYVHAVKGAGRQLACKKLAKSGQDLEDVLRKKAVGDLDSLTEVFVADYHEAFAVIKGELDKIRS